MQGLEILSRDHHVPEIAEAGIDPVDDTLRGQNVLYDLARLLHALLGLVREGHRLPVYGDRFNVLEGERSSCQLHRAILTHVLAASPLQLFEPSGAKRRKRR